MLQLVLNIGQHLEKCGMNSLILVRKLTSEIIDKRRSK